MIRGWLLSHPRIMYMHAGVVCLKNISPVAGAGAAGDVVEARCI